jgi:hypothetical protein
MAMLRSLLALVAAIGAFPAAAATSVQMLTPLNTSVRGGEQRTYSVRFFNALNQPAAGESVTFSNDACGFFQNGQFAVQVTTDMTGVASATFTARNLGIGCWITASAGVSARFNVFTYTAAQVYIDGGPSPAAPRPGEAFTLRAGAYQGAYPIYEAEVAASVVPGTISAILDPASGSMGTTGRAVDFEVVPQDRIGTYEVEVSHRGVARRFAFRNSAQDMWWAGSAENGWGMSVVQHGDMIFAVIYAYDAEGKPTWYVMPGGAWNEAKTAFSGALYSPTGTPYSAYDASKLAVNAPVGQATLAFATAGSAALDYTINGVEGHKAITRQAFGPEATGGLAGLGDMWWGGAAQNGWGIAVLQQYRSLFAVWFTYGADGSPTWFVMPAGHWSSPSAFEGRLYRTTGSPWLGTAYDASRIAPIDVGTFKFTFAGDRATFDYVIDGTPGTMPLERQGF